MLLTPRLPGLRYDGHGALSAGASSRLLSDYAEPARGQLLDFLFKPHFGANLHVCKVEIGGDTQSTDGTEASHQHSRADLACNRGYEFWLMREARLRNPEVVLVGLPWGAPGWVNNQSASGLYGRDMIGYTLSWLSCARDVHGVLVDWVGMWNEKFYAHPTPPSYVKQLRTALDSHGFGATQLILVDGGVPGESNPLWQAAESDAEFNASFAAVGDREPLATASNPRAHPRSSARVTPSTLALRTRRGTQIIRARRHTSGSTPAGCRATSARRCGRARIGGLEATGAAPRAWPSCTTSTFCA